MGKTTAVSSVTAVRPQIKDMLAGGSDEDFAKSLPTSTAVTSEFPSLGGEAPKRKRRTKEEMAAARGESTATAVNAEIDPLMQDPRYAAIMAEMTGGGGKEIMSFAFSLSDKPLSTKEEKKLDDMFYVIAKRSKWNPAESWILFALYFLFAVLSPMIIVRTPIIEKLKAIFEQPTKMPTPPKETKEQKAPGASAVNPLADWQTP